MPIFNYKAIEGRTQHRVRGKIVAFSEADAATRLQSSGMMPRTITDFSGSFYGKLNLLLLRVQTRDLVIFSRQFALLVASSVNIVEAIIISAEQTENLHLKSVLADIAQEVNGGDPLSESFAKRPHIFSSFYINVLRAGETAGKLDEVLLYLADEMEKDYDLTAKFKGALIYPGVILAGLVVVGGIMMFFVMPQITAIIAETGAELPLATRMVIWVVDFFQNYGILMLIGLVILLILLRLLYRTEFGRAKFDRLKLSLPVFGPILQYNCLIKFARAFATLIKGGVPVAKSLEVSEGVSGNWVYSQLIKDALRAVNEGDSISSVFVTSRYIPKMLPEMMAVGEKVGRLDEVLEKVSDFYAREQAAKLENLSKLMEPAIMVIMGIGVGIMVAAIILPMYNMASQF